MPDMRQMRDLYADAKRNTKTDARPYEQGAVTDRMRKLIRQCGGKTLKLHGGARQSGQPDIIGTLMGYAVVIETKRTGEEDLTERQSENLSRWTKAGAIAMGVNDADAAMLELLREIQRRDREK